MKKRLIIFAMILLALTSGCSARVTTFTANSPSSFATPAPAVTLPPAAPITQDLLIGRWKYIKSIASSTGENKSQSLYGSAVKYGGTLNFDKDGMFGKYIGLQIFSGPYTISDASTVYLQSSRYDEVQTIIYDSLNHELVLSRQTEYYGNIYEYFEKVSSVPLPYEEDYH